MIVKLLCLGHQILEAIDEPGGGQRLEQPMHCSPEHYAIMEATWRHRPDQRPTFAQLTSMLEEARPEQVQVIVPGGGPGLLQYNVGEILTVLDKHDNQAFSGTGSLWKGVNNLGKVGLFHPSHTVTYLGNLPDAGHIPPQWSSPHATLDQDSHSAASSEGGIFRRTTLRGSKERSGSGRKKISRDMISGPTGRVQHTGHIGPDGCYFGDVNFISGTNGNLTIGGRLPSTGSDNGFSSWSKADSDASECAPLIATSTGSGGGTSSKSLADKPIQPRMGHAIGYLRKQPDKEDHSHQYQSISDEEAEQFGSPLDLGPSLMDEVFGELENYDTLKIEKNERAGAGGEEEEHHGLHGIVESCHKLKDKVQTLTLSRRHKGKKAAYVKPIKASDERTLENAILMANQIASKSMHDLDKRGTDDMFNASPQVSPLTPNSPSKKFTFKFPASGSSKHKAAHATAPNRHFTDEVERRTDTNSVISSSARDAYRALIDGEDREVFESLPQPPPLSKNTSSLPPHASVHRRSLPPSVMMPAELELAPAKIAPLAEEVSNPLPLPPKDRKSSVTSGRRHIRKNPLIIPSGAAASMARRLEDDSSESLFVAPPPSKTKSRSGGLGTAAAASIQSRKRADNTCGRELETYNDAFEEEIAYSMDALDDLQESRYNSPKTSLETGAPTSNSLGADHRPGHAEDKRDGWVQLMTTQDALDDQNWRSRSKRGLDSDEVIDEKKNNTVKNVVAKKCKRLCEHDAEFCLYIYKNPPLKSMGLLFVFGVVALKPSETLK